MQEGLGGEQGFMGPGRNLVYRMTRISRLGEMCTRYFRLVGALTFRRLLLRACSGKNQGTSLAGLVGAI